MEITQDAVKQWLSAHPERDRFWLAAKCNTEKKTVDNWLSSPRGIPSKALIIIESLMRDDAENAPAAASVETMDVPIRVSVAQFDSYTAAFKSSEQATLRGWMVNRLDQAAADEMGELVRPGPVAVPDARKDDGERADTA